MSAELEGLLNEMKERGIGGAIIQVDGIVVQSTIALNEVNSGLMTAVANVSDAMMKKMEDKQKEVEVSFGGLILVMVPVKNTMFCALIKEREEKKIVAEYAQKASAFL
jgi:uncharacterized membrane protein